MVEDVGLVSLRSLVEDVESAAPVVEQPDVELTERYTGHHHKVGKNYYVDSNFLNAISDTLPGFYLEHMGFGEFVLKGPDDARIDFDRMRGVDFEGQVGRSHKIYDNKGGKLVKKLIKAMEKKNLSTVTEDCDCEDGTLDERAGSIGRRGGDRAIERAALQSKLKKAAEDERRKKKGKAEDDESDEVQADDQLDERGYASVERAAMLSKLKAKDPKAKKKGKKGKPPKFGKDKDDDEEKEEDLLAAELSALLGEDYFATDLPFLLS